MRDDKPQHSWKTIKGFKYSVCARCDLVALKNKKTEKAMNGPCIGQYVKMVLPDNLKMKI